MSTVITTTIFCNEFTSPDCLDNIDLEPGVSEDQFMRQQLLIAGTGWGKARTNVWRRMSNDKHMCPECALYNERNGY